MKKILIAAITVLLLAGCGVGNYSVTSGKADEGAISFTSAKSMPITVTIDNSTYELSSVKDKQWKTDRKIKETAKNTLKVTPGAHDVKVLIDGDEVFSKKLFISASEHKVIEL